MTSGSPSDPIAWKALRAAWAKGGAEGKALDRQRARRQTPEERLAEGRDLVRIAEKLRAGRRDP